MTCDKGTTNGHNYWLYVCLIGRTRHFSKLLIRVVYELYLLLVLMTSARHSAGRFVRFFDKFQ
jgi:hypothetical protein